MFKKSYGYLLATAIMAANANAEINGTMFQYFEWYTTAEDNLWSKLKNETPKLSELGVTAIWIPPAYKGAYGVKDAGYAVYDKYDLGEFKQRGSVRTKYGTLSELLSAVNALHSKQIQVYGDIVLNHLMGDIDKYNLQGADELEQVEIIPVNSANRNQIDINHMRTVNAWTKFTFPGRGGKYSNFSYDNKVISGLNWELISPKAAKDSIYLLNHHVWSQKVDDENGNYDYLLGLNLDYSVPAMQLEAKTWGNWYTNTLKLDGYRLDAVKHIDSGFMKWWLESMRMPKQTLFAVGEYWHGDLNKLEKYENQVNWSMSLFDVPLHFNLYHAAKTPASYDLRHIFDNTMVSKHPLQAVTFVDNHDTEPGQSLESFIEDWFKPLAYTLILTRENGYPCVFYGDYYGITAKQVPAFAEKIKPILFARKNNAYGLQHDYFVSARTIGWTREGTSAKQGLAAVINSDAAARSIDMNVGIMHKSQKWHDITSNCSGEVTIDANGHGVFPVSKQSASIWIPV